LTFKKDGGREVDSSTEKQRCAGAGAGQVESGGGGGGAREGAAEGWLNYLAFILTPWSGNGAGGGGGGGEEESSQVTVYLNMSGDGEVAGGGTVRGGEERDKEVLEMCMSMLSSLGNIEGLTPQ
jgi:hypothetical protein